MSTARPVSTGRKDALGRIVRVSSDPVGQRATAPAPPVGSGRVPTVESMLARHVARGGNPDDGRRLLDDILTNNFGQALAYGLCYYEFATEKQADAYLASLPADTPARGG